LEVQLEELNDQFTEVNKQKLVLEKNLVSLESVNREYKAQAEEFQEQSAMEGERARRAEQTMTDASAEVARSRDVVGDLERTKASLEKHVRELQLRVAELETAVSVDSTRNVKSLESKMIDLTTRLDKSNREKEDLSQNSRRHERLVRDLQFQLAEKEKQRQRSDDESLKTAEKLRRMKQDLMDMEARDSDLLLGKRRVERELDEYKDKSVRLERELDKLRNRLVQPSTQTN
jgi:myosin heavy chain 9/10/11/14